MTRKIFLIIIVAVSFFTIMCIGTVRVDNLFWLKFPSFSKNPVIEFMSYDGRKIYLGFFNKEIDVNLNYRGLLIIRNYSSVEICYNVKQSSFVPIKKAIYEAARVDKFGGQRFDNFLGIYTDEYYMERFEEWLRQMLTDSP